MLLNDTHQVVKHVNLRLQLRGALIALRQPHHIQRRHIHSESHHEPSITRYNAEDKRSTAGTRRIYPDGRVFGVPGRKQRNTSATLRINSLGKTSNVVILSDVEEQAPKQEVVVVDKAAGDNKTIVLEKEVESTREDVFASIEQLRPSESFLTKKEFDKLHRDLSEGYIQQQLKGYLRQAISLKRSRSTTHDPTISIWRSGRSTSLTKLPTPRPVIPRARKEALATQILRDAWGLSVHSEEQEIGEQDITLAEAQISLLNMTITLKDEEVTRWRAMLSSALLARSVEIVPVQEAGFVRIVGRKHDTMQVAEELLSLSRSVKTLSIPMDMLNQGRKKKRHTITVSNKGHNTAGQLILNEFYIAHVRQTTSTYIKLQDDNLTIAGFEASKVQQARILVLSMAGVSGIPTEKQSFETSKHATRTRKSGQLQAIPVFEDQHMAKQQYRLALPKLKSTLDIPQDTNAEIVSACVETAQAWKPMNYPILPEVVSREASIRSTFEARLGYVLQYSTTGKFLDKNNSTKSFMQGGPFSDSILHHFNTRSEVQYRRTIVVHLAPSTHKEKILLPGIELHFVMRTPAKHWYPVSPRFDRLLVKLARQVVMGQLVHKDADIELQRMLHYETRAVDLFTVKDISIASLVKYIESKVAKFRFSKLTDFVPEQELYVRLPTALLMKPEQGHTWSDVAYDFSYIETREEVEYEPHMIEGVSHLTRWAPDTHMSIIESNSGAVGGKRTDVVIRDSVLTSTEVESSAERVTRSALCLLNML